jgi:outer membrane biosynthesis protein TonB
MRTRTFRKEEGAGLAVAAALHVALALVLLQQPTVSKEIFEEKEPERMTVSLVSDIGLESTAPDPVPVSRAPAAPTLADVPAPVFEPAPAEPSLSPAPALAPPLEPVAAPKPKPKPDPKPKQPTAKPKKKPPPKKDTTPRRRPEQSRSQSRTPAPKKTSTPKPATPKKSGGSRINDDFLAGAGTSTTSKEARLPASQIGRSAKASIISSISRQLKPHWSAPQGVDAEKLVTILAFQLNEDGSLKGNPRVVRQTGINASNRPQANLHAERAIRAVRRAAPFDLPKEYYNAWKSISGARFDRDLSR